ncbi:MAG: hypothetical protein GY844_19330 [Bradyrhizobium sp.]|nr:hypothetical protein [Bradyrhizobium sp.]
MPRKLISDDELAALPGYEPDPHERGYYFDSPTGRCAILGAMPGDECHHHGGWGMINISKCIDAIAREKGRPQRTAIDDGLKQNIASYEFDQAYVDSMSVERRDEPIIFIVAADGVHVIDGTHRLRRRIQDGCTDVQLFLLAPTVLRDARVRLMRQQPDGSWHQDGGLSDEDLDREISAAQEMKKKVVKPRE